MRRINCTLRVLSCVSDSPRRALICSLIFASHIVNAQIAKFTEVHLTVPPRAFLVAIRDVSDDGMILGVFQGSGPSEWGFRWIQEGGVENVKPFSHGLQTSMAAVSPSGHVMVGGYEHTDGSIRAGYWIDTEGPFDSVSNTAGYSISFAIGVSADETYICGDMRNELTQAGYGFISLLGGEPRFVGGLPGGSGISSLQGVSAHGERAFGSALSSAVLVISLVVPLMQEFGHVRRTAESRLALATTAVADRCDGQGFTA
jgi:hypothetical protein